MTHSFNTDVAAEHGIEEAVIISFIQEGIKGNIGKKKYFFDGKNWTSVTERELKSSFPYMSPKKIAGVLASLMEKGILVCAQLQDVKYTWYSFHDEGAWLSDMPPVQKKGKKAKKLTEEEAFMNALPVGPVEGKFKSLYERMMSTYYTWHKGCVGIEPLIDGREGKALKSLSVFFLKVAIPRALDHCKHSGEAVTQNLVLSGANTAWGNLLTGLQTANIDPFLKKQKKISQIHHNLTNIIDQLKNGKTGTQGQQQQAGTQQQSKPSNPRQQKQNGLSELEREIALAASVGKYSG